MLCVRLMLKRSRLLPKIDGVLSAEQIRVTAAHIAETQLNSGMIPWFEGGHADPWNHVEAAMALDIGGYRREAEAAYQWLKDRQRPDGSWHQYYLEHTVEQDKLDTNVIAYVATGVWHHYLHHRDRGYLETMWPMVRNAIEYVLRLQQPRGEIIWARHLDGTPWTFALLTGSSSIAHSMRCALAIASELGFEHPGWELSLARLARAIRSEQDRAFAPKHRWAMDWYYPVLTGVINGDAGRRRLSARFKTFCLGDEGIRCVSDRPWVTTAETCECAMAHLSVGEYSTAKRLFAAVQRFREVDGSYITGMVFPQRALFPANECSTYSAAAVLLTAEAIAGSSPAAKLFADHAFLPQIISLDRADSAFTVAT